MTQLAARLGELEAAVEARVGRWVEADVGARLLRKDPTIWSERPDPELANRLGWLDLPRVGEEVLGDWVGFAAAERDLGVQSVVVLGMGGSSLAPEVYQQTFGGRRPWLHVLDSVHPDEIGRLEAQLDLERTLIVVSSKSGSTIETRSLFDYFWMRMREAIADAGRQFVVITDPGSALARLAEERNVHRVFLAPPDVGGRYSALSAFGLVPGALAGTDVRELVRRAHMALEALEAGGRRSRELLSLGAILGEAARRGRDKLTLWTTPSIGSFPVWVEQLVAESTGKAGIGILPVVGEQALEVREYGDDRLFVGLVVDGDAGEREIRQRLEGLADAGHPVATIRLRDALDLGIELFRWEVCVALAGEVLGINPMNQPDVELAKRLAREVMEGAEGFEGRLAGLMRIGLGHGDRPRLADWLDSARGAPYLAVHAYLPRRRAAERRLRALQGALRDRIGRVVTVGFGPRFLHSTGQLHKGGPANARFVQILAAAGDDRDIPGQLLSFGQLGRAQADGDAAALLERGHAVARVELDGAAEVEALTDLVEDSR